VVANNYLSGTYSIVKFKLKIPIKNPLNVAESFRE
jgi:hypothetical protein